MKIVPLLGTMSGKLAGLVASHNRGGQYFRQYVIPVNPNTLAQIQARTDFGTNANLYHMLTDSEKANWAAASAFYLNKSGTPLGVSSGFNIFTAMNSMATHLNAFSIEPDVLKNSTGSPIAITTNNFQSSLVAPSHQLQANYDGTGGILPLTVPNVSYNILTVDSGGQWYIDIEINTANPPASGIGVSNPFTDIHGNQWGLALYMSNAKQQQHNFTNNPGMILLGALRNFTITTPGTGVTTYEIKGTAIVDRARYLNWGNPGQIVELKLYQVGINGMQNLLKTVSQSL